MVFLEIKMMEKNLKIHTDNCKPFPIETALNDINIPIKTENFAIFIIRDEVLLLSVLFFNFL